MEDTLVTMVLEALVEAMADPLEAWVEAIVV